MAFLLPLKPRLVASRSARVREDASRTSLLPIQRAPSRDGAGTKKSAAGFGLRFRRRAKRNLARSRIYHTSLVLDGERGEPGRRDLHRASGSAATSARRARRVFGFVRRGVVGFLAARLGVPAAAAAALGFALAPAAVQVALAQASAFPLVAARVSARRMALPLLPALLLGASIAAARGGAVPLREAHFVVQLEREFRQRRLRLADGRRRDAFVSASLSASPASSSRIFAMSSSMAFSSACFLRRTPAPRLSARSSLMKSRPASDAAPPRAARAAEEPAAAAAALPPPRAHPSTAP